MLVKLGFCVLVVDELSDFELEFEPEFELELELDLAFTVTVIVLLPVTSSSYPGSEPDTDVGTIVILAVPGFTAVNVNDCVLFSGQTGEPLTFTTLVFEDEISKRPPHFFAVILTVVLSPSVNVTEDFYIE